MFKVGLAYRYQQYSGNCESVNNLSWAEKIVREGFIMLSIKSLVTSSNTVNKRLNYNH